MALSQDLAAKLVNLGVLPLEPHVFLDLLELVHRHVELVAVLVGEEQKIVFDAAHVQMRQFLVDADPVVHVDDEIALVQVLERIEENTRNRLLAPPA